MFVVVEGFIALRIAILHVFIPDFFTVSNVLGRRNRQFKICGLSLIIYLPYFLIFIYFFKGTNKPGGGKE
jgi:hypothetical protein